MKKLAALISNAILYLYVAAPAFAQQGENIALCPANSDFSAICNTNISIGSIVRFTLVTLLIAAVVVAVVFLIWGGIKWITSGGDKAKVESARGTIIGAIIGLVVAMAAYFIVNIVYQLLTGQPIDNFTFPGLSEKP